MAVPMETAFTRLVGIEHPIVQAPIGTLTNPQLAAAVSNAGGLGMLALGGAEPERLRRAVAETQALTDRPFGVNLNLRRPQAERIEAALDAGVRFISLFWGDPAGHVAAIHDAGAIVSATVGDAGEARRCADVGVDLIVAQGWEAGGHVWGGVATLPLVPAVVDAVTPTPVVAAGGIGDGRGLAAVLALGAAGAWLGTRFVMSEEARALPAYTDRLDQASEADTIYSLLFDGGWPDAPHRSLRNALTDAWEKAGRPAPGDRDGEGDVIGRTAAGEPIARYQSISPAEGYEGDVDSFPMWAGQSVGTIHDVRPAGEIVRSIVAEAEATLRGLAG
jgi:NAD(P)H-dependent flavin oxidoreductase YrpB (nitropropane dioxygenase family)